MAANQWTGQPGKNPISNPMPEWVPGVGYAPTPPPPAGRNAPPGYHPLMDPTQVQQLQAQEAARQAAARQPSGGGSSSRTSTLAAAPAPPKAPRKPQSLESKLAVPSPGPGWVRTASGDWVPPDHPLAQGPLWQEQGGGQTTTTTNTGPVEPSVRDRLLGLADAAGRPNTEALNLRLQSAREQMERNRKSQSDSLMAQLSSLGLLGDGATIEGLGGIEEDLAAIYGDTTNQIYADEYNRADNRMMEALSLLTGMDIADLDREVDWFNARSNKDIGLKNAAANMKSASASMKSAGADVYNSRTNRMRAKNDYSLGLGNLKLGSDDQLLRAIALMNEDY